MEEKGLQTVLITVVVGFALWWVLNSGLLARVNPMTPSLTTQAPPSSNFIVGALTSVGQRLGIAKDPTTFAGQSGVEHRVAADAGGVATTVAGRVPVFGPVAQLTAGRDTTVNITQGEASVHGIGDIAQGNFRTGAKEIASSAITAGVQPVRSAVGVVTSLFSKL